MFANLFSLGMEVQPVFILMLHSPNVLNCSPYPAWFLLYYEILFSDYTKKACIPTTEYIFSVCLGIDISQVGYFLLRS